MTDDTKKQIEYQSQRISALEKGLSHLRDQVRQIDVMRRCPICGDVILSKAYLGKDEVHVIAWDMHQWPEWAPPKDEVHQWFLICDVCGEHLSSHHSLRKKTWNKLHDRSICQGNSRD